MNMEDQAAGQENIAQPEEVPEVQEEPVEYRACFNCQIIRTFAQFYSEGCPNCEKYMKLKNNVERVVHCTTLDFHGLLQMAQPLADWKGRIKDIESFVPGAYAELIFGIMPSRFLFQVLSEDEVDGEGVLCL